MTNRRWLQSWVLAIWTGVTLAVAGCSKGDEYSQDTPQDTVNSAVAMVKDGRADRLTTLIYPESPEFNAVLQRLSGFLGTLQDVAVEARARFPAEIEKYRQEATKSTPAARNVLAAIQRPSRGGGGAEDRAQREAVEDTLGRLLADPFNWIERNAERLTTVSVSDDAAAVLLDGKPVPPIGLAMKKVQGRWYVQLPLNLPVVSQYMPQTRQEWSIIASLVKVLDNAVQELGGDIRSGSISSIEQLASKTGEKAFIPGAMVFVVYSKEMDVRGRRNKVMAQYRKAQAAWVAHRARAGADQEALGRLAAVLPLVVVEPIDKLVRTDTARPRRDAPRETPAFAEMKPGAFEATVEPWLAEKGWKGSLGELTQPGEIDALIARIKPPTLAGG